MDEDNFTEQIRQIVRQELAGFLGSSQYQFQKDAKFYDGRNIQTGNVTGTMIGTAATQKLGFYGTAPIAQSTLPPIPVLADVVTMLKATGITK